MTSPTTRRAGRRLAAAMLLVVVGAGPAGLVACGDSADDETEAGPGAGASAGSDAGLDGDGRYPLPFGLDQVEGTEPIGRPAVYDENAYYYDGEPVPSRSLVAAYRVTADDPRSVFRAWVDQLGHALALDDMMIDASRDGPSSLWMQATALGHDESVAAGGDYADLQLWATDGDPILLVSVNRISDDPPRRPTIQGEAGNPPAPTGVVEDTERTVGDVLFTEQGSEIHVPEGTRPLMPTLPTWRGTGGSTSVLAADDGEAAVRALLDEAQAASDYSDVTGPEVTESEGIEIVTADFTIPAGGWAFEVVSVRAPGDPAATVYVTSSAD